MVLHSSHSLDPLSPSWCPKLSTQRNMNAEMKFEHDPARGAEYMKTMKKLAVASLLPKSELVTFDGNPLRYHIFMKSFETNVEKDTDDYSRRLQLLMQFYVGKVKKVIENCTFLGQEEGYEEAKRLHSERFGDKYKVTMKTDYGSETVTPLYITGCREKIYSESDLQDLLFTQYFEFAIYGIKHYIIANKDVNKEMNVVIHII